MTKPLPSSSPPPHDALRMALAMIPEVKKLTEFFHHSHHLGVFLFGGAVRDILLKKSSVNDLDFMIIDYDKKINSHAAFAKLVNDFSQSINATCTEVPPYHLSLLLGSGKTFDIHFPHQSPLAGVSRSEFTVNGIAYNCATGEMYDPLGGIDDLKAKKLRIHSPSYALTNAQHLPRFFRIAASLGFEMDKECLDIISRFGHMVYLNDGRPPIMVIIELLRFLSLETVAPYLSQMMETRLLEYTIPELTPLYEAAPGKNAELRTKSVGARNISEIERSSETSLLLPERIRAFLLKTFGVNSRVNEFGFIRLCWLFHRIGESYYEMAPECPYIEGAGCTDKNDYARRMEKNLLSFFASRYKEYTEVAPLLNQILPIVQISSLLLTAPQEQDLGILVEDLKRQVPEEILSRGLVLAALISESARDSSSSPKPLTALLRSL